MLYRFYFYKNKNYYFLIGICDANGTLFIHIIYDNTIILSLIFLFFLIVNFLYSTECFEF